MDYPKIILLGGCHVAGYPVGQENAFSTKLSDLLDGEIVGQVARVRIIDLPQHLKLVEERKPTHVVLQLGNHEFSASVQLMLRQLTRALGRVPAPKKAGTTQSTSSGSSSSSSSSSDSAPGQPLLPPGKFYRLRVVGLSLLTLLLWLFGKQYRHSIKALNSCMALNPDTTFVFLSPFPCKPLADNDMRAFGGWLLRHRVAALPNRYWLDSHQVLHADRDLFTDPWHLNAQAHTALAYSLAGVFYSNTEYTHVAQH
jgi:hypothetical protein